MKKNKSVKAIGISSMASVKKQVPRFHAIAKRHSKVHANKG